MFKRITFSSIPFLKSIKALISYSSKNPCGLHLEPFLAQRIVKTSLIILIDSPLLENHVRLMTSQELPFISISDSLRSIFLFEKTLLIIEIFYLLPFSMIMTFFGS